MSDLTPVAQPHRSAARTGVKAAPVARYQEPQTHYFKVPNEVADVLMQMLDDDEFKLYFRLFRLSHGYKQTTCFVGYAGLARACKMPLGKVKRVMPRLLARGLVRVLEVCNGPEMKGTRYEVLTGSDLTPVAQPNRSVSDTGRTAAPNKGKEEDHDPKTNHHQSEVMRIYTELTGKPWTKADAASYRKVADVPLEKLESFLHLIHQRATDPPGSFAFFATSIQNELAAGAQSQAAARQGQGGLKKKYQKFAADIRAAYTGGSLSVSALIFKLKSRCIREGVSWNDDVANEVLGL